MPSKFIMVKQTAIIFMKLALLYLFLPMGIIGIALFKVSLPGRIFQIQPFFIAGLFVVVIAAAISVAIKSKTPILWAMFSIAYSAFFFISSHALTLIALCLIIGAVSFIFRSKFTEPFLVLLPLIAGAWLFLQIVYAFSFVTWVYYVSGQKGLSDSLIQGAISLNGQAIQIAIISPLLAMYFLGKHSYVKVYAFIRSLRR